VAAQTDVEALIRRMYSGRQSPTDECQIQILFRRQVLDVLDEVLDQCSNAGVRRRRRLLGFSFLPLRIRRLLRFLSCGLGARRFLGGRLWLDHIYARKEIRIRSLAAGEPGQSRIPLCKRAQFFGTWMSV